MSSAATKPGFESESLSHFVRPYPLCQSCFRPERASFT